MAATELLRLPVSHPVLAPVKITRMSADERLTSERFPRASACHPEWVLAGVSGGANPLWLTEWLAEAIDLQLFDPDLSVPAEYVKKSLLRRSS